jgi:hypothetical protein
MWGFLLNLIGGPIVSGIISAYKAKLAATNTTDAQAADLAKAEILGEIQDRQTEASIIRQEQGWWVTALPRPMLAFIFVIWLGKVVVWDGCFGLGSTDPLGPEADWAMRIVLTGYFGGRTIEKVARIFKR